MTNGLGMLLNNGQFAAKPESRAAVKVDYFSAIARLRERLDRKRVQWDALGRECGELAAELRQLEATARKAVR